MMSNNGDYNSVHVHYTPTIDYSIGFRSEYRRENEVFLNAIQLNTLVKRWNKANSQANFYIKSGAGIAYSDHGKYQSETEAAGFTGIALDWEDRDYFTSFENRFLHTGELGHSYMQSARVGFTPYVGEYGDLHTWLMLEVEHEPTAQNPLTYKPLIRLFKDVHLAELGMNNHGEVTFNWVIRY